MTIKIKTTSYMKTTSNMIFLGFFFYFQPVHILGDLTVMLHFEDAEVMIKEFVITTGCSAGIDIKFLLNARARNQPIN